MEKNKRQLVGHVTSNKMTKTVVVRIEVVKVHPKYHKRYKIFKKYPAHNELPDVKIGDKVTIEESKPYSKTVNWKVTSKA